MDPKFCFTIFLFLFLSWSLQGLSQDTEAADDLTSSLDNLGGGLADLMLGATNQGAGGADGMSCIKKLLPCQSYMHSSSPPESCCRPLEDIILTDSQCLCMAFKDPQILKTFNLTLDEALAVPYACGIDVDMTVCSTLPTSPGASPTRASPKASKSKAPTPTSAPTTPSDSGSSTDSSSDSSNSPSESINSSSSSSPSNSGNPSSNPASNSSAAITVTRAFSNKFVTVCVLMVAAFHL